ncbi:MAG: hypothetical protein C0429_11360 [Sphingopyxis sp.]|nr:hypothetical protein [Sphingopyxis sp.]
MGGKPVGMLANHLLHRSQARSAKESAAQLVRKSDPIKVLEVDPKYCLGLSLHKRLRNADRYT